MSFPYTTLLDTRQLFGPVFGCPTAFLKAICEGLQLSVCAHGMIYHWHAVNTLP